MNLKKTKTKQNILNKAKEDFKSVSVFDLKSQEEQLSHMLKATDLTCSTRSSGSICNVNSASRVCIQKCLVSLSISITFSISKQPQYA